MALKTKNQLKADFNAGVESPRNLINSLLDSANIDALPHRLKHIGTVPTVAFSGGSAAGDIEAQSTDVGGIINVTTQLANTNTCTVTFATAYDTAPTVVVGGLINYKYTTSTTALTITATGNTGAGELHYIVMENV